MVLDQKNEIDLLQAWTIFGVNETACKNISNENAFGVNQMINKQLWNSTKLAFLKILSLE
ncbi:unnamed protein product [Paramecium octaurelia]|uniref:Uncharacterized protein n=1 Tax=Paramecium octaurelia TaxID=43137 RepID=A0A8S1VC45_PAROT|nr:unnamed protein product [Paramecium octaurelia]